MIFVCRCLSDKRKITKSSAFSAAESFLYHLNKIRYNIYELE